MVSFNQGFNLNIIGKFWYKREKIIWSINVGSYFSLRLIKYISDIDDVEPFPISNVEDLGDENLSQFISTCYEKKISMK